MLAIKSWPRTSFSKMHCNYKHKFLNTESHQFFTRHSFWSRLCISFKENRIFWTKSWSCFLVEFRGYLDFDVGGCGMIRALFVSRARDTVCCFFSEYPMCGYLFASNNRIPVLFFFVIFNGLLDNAASSTRRWCPSSCRSTMKYYLERFLH